MEILNNIKDNNDDSDNNNDNIDCGGIGWWRIIRSIIIIIILILINRKNIYNNYLNKIHIDINIYSKLGVIYKNINIS